ncbi:MAG: hypothetical protein HY875_01790 [Chloroflexi bacterium]|nr:hypothetical protein [Chloroflexota bacterium]
MLQNPRQAYEEALRRHEARLAEAAARASLRAVRQPQSRWRCAAALFLRRAAARLDGQGIFVESAAPATSGSEYAN